MATHTTNYNLTKPSTSDNVSITPINNNFDIIDDELHTNASAIAGKMPITGGTFSGAVAINGSLILSSSAYGTELPDAGTPGRIFFKKV